MNSDALFFHDLKNDIFILKMLVKKIQIENDTADRINKIINKINDKVTDVFNNSKYEKNLLDMNTFILNLKSDYSTLEFKKDLAESVSFMGNKSQLDDVLANIIKNSHDAGATFVRFELRNNSLTIRDNGNCTFEAIEKLNNGNQFTTKSDGSGFGTQGIRKFCKINNCSVVFFCSQFLCSKTGNRGLAVRIKFPVSLPSETVKKVA